MLGDILGTAREEIILKYLQKSWLKWIFLSLTIRLNSLTDTDKKDLMEIIEDRYMMGSTIIASQLPTKDCIALSVIRQ